MPGEKWHALPVEEVLSKLGVSVEEGLSVGEAERRLRSFGLNELPRGKRRSLLHMFAGQLYNAFIIVLLIAAAIATALGETLESTAIVAIVLMAAVLGTWQEFKAERTLERLRELMTPRAKVVRSGKRLVVDARHLVPGDIVILEAGDRVPADVRLVESRELYLDESLLTGESKLVEKRANIVVKPDAPIFDRVNMAFMGTHVIRGKALGVVVATGAKTETGKIAKMVAEVEEEETMIHRQLRDLSGKLLILFGVLCGALFGILVMFNGFTQRVLVDAGMTSIALAVAAVPEALPAIVTLTLALGVWRMAGRNAIVRRMAAVHTLGSVEVVCCDKTGTLTANEMTVVKVYTPRGIYRVTGVGYTIRGEVIDEKGNPVILERHPHLKRLAYTAILCNDSRIETAGDRAKIEGDPTEAAILIFAAKMGVKIESIRKRYAKMGEIPFSSERMYMATQHTLGKGRSVVCMKGAPEAVLPRCSKMLTEYGEAKLTAEKRREIEQEALRMMKEGLRVLAVAYCEGGGLDRLEDMVFLGLLGIHDPPREGVKEALEKSWKAGVKVVMITGDHKETAMAVAESLGMKCDEDQVALGDELEKLREEELSKHLDRLVVIARAVPELKMKIVRAFKRRKCVVAMTGDGVNDAPALKAAHVGIAMGRRGTEVAKEAADIVLADDNFSSIVAAIEEGRTITDNVRKATVYLLAVSFTILFIVFIAAVFITPGVSPLTPLQILLINLILQGLPAIAIAFDSPSPRVMERKPAPLGESIMRRKDWHSVFITAAVISAVTLAIYVHSLQTADFEAARLQAYFLAAIVPLGLLVSVRKAYDTPVTSNSWLALAVLISILVFAATVWVKPLAVTFGIKAPPTPTVIGITLAFTAAICLMGPPLKLILRTGES